MNKRAAVLTLIILGIFMISSVAVHAQEGKRFTDMFQKIGEFLFHDLGAMGAYGFKFLLWITLFALIQYSLADKGPFDRKTAGILSFTVSLATIILIPGSVVIKLFSLYANLVIIALGLVVPLILAGVIHKKFDDNSLADIAIRSVGYLAVSAAMFWFSANVNIMLNTGII